MINKTLNNPEINIGGKLLSDIQDDVNFNGYSLSSYCKNGSEGIVIINNPLAGMSDIELSEFINGQEDGGGIISRRYSGRNLNLKIQITGKDYNDLLKKIDDLKKNISGIEGELNFKFGDTFRTLKATLNSWTAENLRINRNDVDINLGFRILSPHWYLKKSTSYLFENIINLNYSDIIDNKGTGNVKPKFILAFNSSGNTNITKIEIKLKKLGDNEGYSVILNKNIVNGDLVIFDFKDIDISINGNGKQQFDGMMSEFKPDLNVFDINIVGDNVKYEASVIYNEIYK